MALKMDRQVDAVDISYFMNEVAERGVIVSKSTAGSGVAMDSPKNLATVPAAASGASPIGMLSCDVIDVDRTVTPLNWHKDVQALGDKVCIFTKGWYVTNKIIGTPTGKELAALSMSGYITPVAIGTPGTAAVPLVGRFRSGLSEEGFAKVYIDL
jgi:hypothetical protein